MILASSFHNLTPFASPFCTGAEGGTHNSHMIIHVMFLTKTLVADIDFKHNVISVVQQTCTIPTIIELHFNIFTVIFWRYFS